MDSSNNIRAIPNTERDSMQAAFNTLERLMPQQAKIAKTMQEEFIKAGFSEDDALTLVAYALFRK